MVAVRSASQVKQAYADLHGVKNADPLIAYRSAFQGAFNAAISSSQFHQTFEVQASKPAKAAGVVTQIVSGLTSFFGGSLIGVAGTAVVELDKANSENKLRKLSELQPAIESCDSRLQKFSEGLAEKLTILSRRKLTDLNKQEAATLAKADAKFLLEQIIAGNFNDLIEDLKLTGLGDEAKEEKAALENFANSMIEKVEEKKGLNFDREKALMEVQANAKNGDNIEKSTPQHHQHQDLGKFTHAIVENESHQQTEPKLH